MKDIQTQQLIAAAIDARKNAYAKYSGFQVGAAVLTASGEIYSGCNVENVSYGLTICAERAAICTAVAAGHQDFAAIAVATVDSSLPCGACRQFMAEFSADLAIFHIGVGSENRIEETRLANLLPNAFRSFDQTR